MGYETLPERIRDTDPALALYLVGLLGALIAMYVLEWILIRLNIDSAREGLVAGLMIGVVFNIFSLITIYSFAEEPIEIAMIDFGANALVFLFAGLLLGAWRKYQ
jgi:xanthosine utilization system XapX-like protein